MTLKERLTQLKFENQEHAQVTVRISKNHKKMIQDRIRAHAVKEGQYLRVLLEDAIERESNAEAIMYKKTVSLFRKEDFDSLKKEVEMLSTKLNYLQEEFLREKSVSPSSTEAD